MTDYKEKKAAFEQRLKQLDADGERITTKRKQAEAGIAECDRMLAGGEAPAAKPARAKRSAKK